VAIGCDWVLVVVVVGSLSFGWLTTRLSKSGSYVGSWEVGGIVDRRIGKCIVRSYIFSNLKQKKNILIMTLYVE